MLQNILLVTDGSAPAKRAADFAATLATRFGSTIIVLHAYDRVPPYMGQPYYNEALASALEGAHALTDEVVKHLREIGVADVVKDVLEGPAADAILRAAETRKPDLIVIGARGLSTWQGLLLGSVSMAVTQRAECPVLVIK
jgi:nucleotide-binding universal stress UspA family protein